MILTNLIEQMTPNVLDIVLQKPRKDSGHKHASFSICLSTALNITVCFIVRGMPTQRPHRGQCEQH